MKKGEVASLPGSHIGFRSSLAVSFLAFASLLGGLAVYLLDGREQRFEAWLPELPGAASGFSGEVTISLPPWLAYHLPDAAWAFALVLVVAYLFRTEARHRPGLGLPAAVALALCWEAGQYQGIVPGTPDPLDVAFSAMAGIGAFLLATRRVWRPRCAA